jgi:hypothetical protein
VRAALTVRRASRQAIQPVRTRGDTTCSSRLRARSCSISQRGASAASIACVLVKRSPLRIAWRPRAKDVRPRSAITGSTHISGRRVAHAQYPHNSAHAALRTFASVTVGSISCGGPALRCRAWQHRESAGVAHGSAARRLIVEPGSCLRSWAAQARGPGVSTRPELRDRHEKSPDLCLCDLRRPPGAVVRIDARPCRSGRLMIQPALRTDPPLRDHPSTQAWVLPAASV